MMDSPSIDTLKFEAALAELEALVRDLEGGQLELEAAIAAYRRGTALLAHGQRLLADAESQIRLLDTGEIVDLAAPDRTPA